MPATKTKKTAPNVPRPNPIVTGPIHPDVHDAYFQALFVEDALAAKAAAPAVADRDLEIVRHVRADLQKFAEMSTKTDSSIDKAGKKTTAEIEHAREQIRRWEAKIIQLQGETESGAQFKYRRRNVLHSLSVVLVNHMHVAHLLIDEIKAAGVPVDDRCVVIV